MSIRLNNRKPFKRFKNFQKLF